MKEENIKTLKTGGIGVTNTDTILGIVGNALNKSTVERIYRLKKRNLKKPFIILISEIKELEKFDIKLDKKTKEILKKYWPGKVSIILPCESKKFEYLHRGNKSLAFRLPSKKSLINTLKKTGPLVAPSANPEGLEPAKNLKESQKYFEDKVDFYHIQKSITNNKPSTLIKIEDEKIEILRK